MSSFKPAGSNISFDIDCWSNCVFKAAEWALLNQHSQPVVAQRFGVLMLSIVCVHGFEALESVKFRSADCEWLKSGVNIETVFSSRSCEQNLS